jgi:hypothetical protein
VTALLAKRKSAAVGAYLEDHIETKSWTSLDWHDQYEMYKPGLSEFTKLSVGVRDI